MGLACDLFVFHDILAVLFCLSSLLCCSVLQMHSPMKLAVSCLHCYSYIARSNLLFNARY
jgi:hypothetical protein